MENNLTWTSEKRRLSDLTPWEHNPRQLTEKQAKHLTESIRRFGQVIPLSISPDGEIYDGHQRQYVMRLMNELGEDAEVDVRVASRQLSTDERRELVIRLHENTGEWNFDGLANLYDLDELRDWGFDENKLLQITAPDFPEYDESIAEGMNVCICPICGHEHAKKD